MTTDADEPSAADFAVGDAVYWQSGWSKPIPALVIEVGDERVRVALKKRRQISDYWTPPDRLTPADPSREHEKLAVEAREFFQHTLF